jgi:hypothetical protein
MYTHVWHSGESLTNCVTLLWVEVGQPSLSYCVATEWSSLDAPWSATVVAVWVLELLSVQYKTAGRLWRIASAHTEDFSFKTYIPAAVPAHPCIQWTPAAHSPRVKRPGHEADLSPSPRAEVKNDWSYTPTPPVCLRGVYRDGVIFHMHERILWFLVSIVSCRKTANLLEYVRESFPG